MERTMDARTIRVRTTEAGSMRDARTVRTGIMKAENNKNHGGDNHVGGNEETGVSTRGEPVEARIVMAGTMRGRKNGGSKHKDHNHNAMEKKKKS